MKSLFLFSVLLFSTSSFAFNSRACGKRLEFQTRALLSLTNAPHCNPSDDEPVSFNLYYDDDDSRPEQGLYVIRFNNLDKIRNPGCFSGVVEYKIRKALTGTPEGIEGECVVESLRYIPFQATPPPSPTKPASSSN